jgi:hypothetical protein
MILGGMGPVSAPHPAGKLSRLLRPFGIVFLLVAGILIAPSSTVFCTTHLIPEIDRLDNLFPSLTFGIPTAAFAIQLFTINSLI